MKQPHPRAPQFGHALREYSNAPLRDGKGSNYEGGIRVPMIVRWRDNIEPGTVIETPVHAIDVAPTFLEIGSAPPPENHVLDGQSLVQLVRTGTDASLNDRPLYQYYPAYEFNWGLTPSASIRRGDFKLIEFFGDRIDTKHRYAAGHHIELYNLREDIGEQQDLAATDPQRADNMTKQLHDWMESLGAKRSGLNPHYDPDRAFLTVGEKPEWLK